MSDLYIEARLQAIKDIASASCVDIKDADNIASFCDEIYSAIPNLDKIVEELETKENEAILKAPNTSDLQNPDYQKWMMKSYGFKEAIEIVKQGGVSDDMCEWKLEDDNLITGCGDYFNLYDNCTEKFKYCPVCGKKIKVVD